MQQSNSGNSSRSLKICVGAAIVCMRKCEGVTNGAFVVIRTTINCFIFTFINLSTPNLCLLFCSTILSCLWSLPADHSLAKKNLQTGGQQLTPSPPPPPLDGGVRLKQQFLHLTRARLHRFYIVPVYSYFPLSVPAAPIFAATPAPNSRSALWAKCLAWSTAMV